LEALIPFPGHTRPTIPLTTESCKYYLALRGMNKFNDCSDVKISVHEYKGTRESTREMNNYTAINIDKTTVTVRDMIGTTLY